MQDSSLWPVIRFSLELMGVSLLLSLLTWLWRRKRPSIRPWYWRTYWEWLPFLLGATTLTSSLPRFLGASDDAVSLARSGAHVPLAAAFLLILRAVVLLVVRAFRFVKGDAPDREAEPDF